LPTDTALETVGHGPASSRGTIGHQPSSNVHGGRGERPHRRRRRAIPTKSLALSADSQPATAYGAAGAIRGKAIDPQQLIEITRGILDDGKAEDVVVIDLSRKSSFADAMVIASALNARQV